MYRLSIIAVVALLAGCYPLKGSFLKAAPPAKLQPGWHVVSQPTEGYSVQIPAGWTPVDASGFDPQNPSFKSNDIRPMFVSLLKEPNGTKTLYAMKGDLLNAQMMAISKQDKGRAAHADVEADSLEAQLRRNDMMNEVKRETLDLPCGKAERIRGEISAPGKSTYQIVYSHYFLTDGPNLYEAVFLSTGTEEAAPSKEIMKTFRVTKLVGGR
jgi:hypothetical protein